MKNSQHVVVLTAENQANWKCWRARAQPKTESPCGGPDCLGGFGRGRRPRRCDPEGQPAHGGTLAETVRRTRDSELKEAARPGRPAQLPSDRVQRVVSQVVQPPPGRRRWTCRSMARHSGVSKSQVAPLVAGQRTEAALAADLQAVERQAL